MVPSASAIIAVAVSQLEPRLQESPLGSNDGKELRAFLRKTPFQPGEAWCYYFALACVLQAMGKPPRSVAITGSCDFAGKVAHSFDALSLYAATGAIFLLPDKNGRFHHAGIVTGIREANDAHVRMIETIEGNTNNNGSREGTGVYSHLRTEKGLSYIVW